MKNAEYYAWEGDRDCSLAHRRNDLDEQVSSDLDARGRELPDPVPMAPPVGMSQGPSLADFVQRMIRNEVSRAAAAAEMETFEESDDFDIEDDPRDPLTPYEQHFETKIPADWPMYLDPKTGRYGQLPPHEAAPEGFVRLEPERRLPEGWKMPDVVAGGVSGGNSPPDAKPSAGPPKPDKGSSDDAPG